MAADAPARSSWLDRATLALAALAGVGLLAMVALVFVAVILRYAFAQPILGVNEIVQLLAVGLVMLALPGCTARGGHVRADVFDTALGRFGRAFGDVLSRALSIVALGVLVRRSWDKTLEALEFADATNMLGLPLWPFYGMMALGMGLCALIFAVQIVAILAARGETS
jgi:TRAP-type C4-dicarboxylate transport system permease small subunit